MSMCGLANLSSAKFLAHVGDWTWELVSNACGANPYKAYTNSGYPAYLAYIYIHIRAGEKHPLDSIRPGAEIDVASRVYSMGSEAVGTIHQLRPQDPAANSLSPTYEAMYDNPDSGSLYVETFNKWISRSDSGNENLVKSTPEGFTFDHLPCIPEAFLPTERYRSVLSASSNPELGNGFEPIITDYETSYVLDRDRDVNGVGLVYYATFLDISEQATTRACLGAEIEDRSKIRSITDQQIVYLANCDFGKSVCLKVGVGRMREDNDTYVSNVSMTRGYDQTLLAVCTTRFRFAEAEHVPKQYRDQANAADANSGGVQLLHTESGETERQIEPLIQSENTDSEVAGWKEKSGRLIRSLRETFGDEGIDVHTKLLSSEIIDSFGMLEYIATAERIFDCEIPDSLRRVEVLDSVATLLASMGGQAASARLDNSSQDVNTESPPKSRAKSRYEPEAMTKFPLSFGGPQKPRRSTGFWTRYYQLRFRLKGIKYGKGLRVFGPILLRLDGDPRNITIGNNVNILPGVDLKIREKGKIVIHDGVQLDTGARLVAPNDATIELGEEVKIGPFSIINAGANITFARGSMCGGFCYVNGSNKIIGAGKHIAEQGYTYNPVQIGEDVWIAGYVTVNMGSRIGAGAVIGSYSTISGDVPPDAIMLGSPAKVIKYRV